MTLRQVTYTTPGTWTWPGNIDFVEVILVGGGGGAGRTPGPVFPTGGAGGGGGVRTVTVPVTGPVPYTIGAGGTSASGPAPTLSNTPGGDTSFGSYSVGGGGRSRGGAPPDGGGTGTITQPPGLYGKNISPEVYPGADFDQGVGGSADGPIWGGVQHFGTCIVKGEIASLDYQHSWGAKTRQYGAGAYMNSLPPASITIPAVGGCVIVKWFE